MNCFNQESVSKKRSIIWSKCMSSPIFEDVLGCFASVESLLPKVLWEVSVWMKLLNHECPSKKDGIF